MTHATQALDQMRPPHPAEPGSGVYSNKLGMWVFLASDVMFFTDRKSTRLNSSHT